MTDRLETALVRALATTERVVPPPDLDLAASTIALSHRRRRRGIGVAAALALLVLAPVALLIPRGPSDPVGAHTAVPVRVNLDRILDGVPPAHEVWPDALRLLPARLPGGTAFTVIAQLASGAFVVQEAPASWRHGAVWRYDPPGVWNPRIGADKLGPDRAWVIGDGRYVAFAAVRPSGLPITAPSDPNAVIHQLLVFDIDKGTMVERVNLPRQQDGPTTSLPSGPLPVLGAIAWARGRVIWELRRPDGIRSAAAPQGTPATAPYRLARSGAWAYSPDTANGLTWWNLDTGERHVLDVGSDVPFATCGTWCALVPRDQRAPTEMRVATFDGVRYVATMDRLPDLAMEMLNGHFALLRVPGRDPVLWHLPTGELGTVAGGAEVLRDAGPDILPVPGRSGVGVLNLAAIGP